MSERGIKVTDKRMFNAEGELRDEYRELADAAPPQVAAMPEPAAPEPARAQVAEPEAPPERRAAAPPEVPEYDLGGADAEGPPLEIPGAPPGMGPAFYDLVQVLADPAIVYLGDAPLPDGRSAENLEAARFYIDLLDLLRQRTAGNVTVQEAGYLDEILYRLRLRYVQKRG